MTEKQPSGNYENHESSPQSEEIFDVSSLVGQTELDEIRKSVEQSHSERQLNRNQDVDAATAGVYELFNSSEPANVEPQRKSVYVNGKEVVIAESYRDKSGSNGGQGNEWVVYKNENGQEVHTMNHSEKPPTRRLAAASPENVAQSEAAIVPDDTLAAVESAINVHRAREATTYETNRYPNRSIDVANAMERMGVEFKYDEFLPDSEIAKGYEGIYTLSHEKEPTEPTVRLYRGVNALDSSIFNQSSYVVKGVDDMNADPERREHAKNDIQNFTENPTYENLASYTNTVKRLARRAADKDNLEDRLRTIENDILGGTSLERSLAVEHIASSAGGNGIMLDISPYIATGNSAEIAAKYGHGAVIVLDVPESMIAGYGEGGEVLVAGSLSVDNVAAVAIRSRDTVDDTRGEYAQEYAGAIGELVPTNGSKNHNEVKGRIDSRISQNQEKNLALNRNAVDKKRAEALRSIANDDILQEAGIEWNPDLSYREQQQYLFDFFNSRLEEPIEGQDYDMEGDHGYSDYLAADGVVIKNDRLGSSKGIYSRETPTDGMLHQMKRKFIVEDDRRYYREQRRQQRAKMQ